MRAKGRSGGTPGSTLRHRLPPVNRPWESAMGCLAVTLLVNGITWVFVWVQYSSMDHGLRPHVRWEGWKGWLFLAPFILIGLAALVLFVINLYQAINDSRGGTTIVEASMNPLEPGQPCKFFVSSPGLSAFGTIVVHLVCVEEVKYNPYGISNADGRNATKAKRVRELEMHRAEGHSSVAGVPFERTFDFEFPASAMHSFEVENNKITWLLEVAAGPGDPPAVQRQFAIVVNPPRSSGAGA